MILKIANVIISMINKIEDFDFDNIFIDEKLHENVSVWNILYKMLIFAKPMRISFNKINRFRRVYDKIT